MNFNNFYSLVKKTKEVFKKKKPIQKKRRYYVNKDGVDTFVIADIKEIENEQQQ